MPRGKKHRESRRADIEQDAAAEATHAALSPPLLQRGQQRPAARPVAGQNAVHEEEEEQHDVSNRVPKLRPVFMQTLDSRAMAWETWFCLFRFFLDAESINFEAVRFEKQQIAALYCELGAKGAASALNFAQTTLGATTVKRLHHKFVNWKSQLHNRAKFFQRGQLNIEDILGYVTEIRQFAGCCGFNGVKDKLILDRLLSGCRVQQIREKLLLERDDLTLSDTLIMAQAVKRALQESGQLAPESKNNK